MAGKNKTGIPNGERVWISYYDQSDELKFVMTSKEKDTAMFYLYEVSESGLKKIGRGGDPSEIEDKFHMHEKGW